MTRDQIDILWGKALRQSVKDGEMFTRYHFAALVAAAERDRICTAIKEEDDYTVTQGDYMLDSDDCIKVVRGEWVRPDYSLGDKPK